MRRRRTPGPPVVAVTGAASGLGEALLGRLAGRADLAVVGVDAGPAPDGVDWRPADVRDPLLAERLAGVRTVVHLAPSYDPGLATPERRARNVRGTALLLDAARDAGVRRVVLLSSTDVLGPVPGGRLPLTERSPLRAPADESPTGDLVELERLADHARRTGLDVVVLRPAAVVGAPRTAYAGGRLRALAAPRLLAVRGVEPLWQLCHVEDLLSALELVAAGRGRGVLTVASEGWLAQSVVEAVAGRRRLELPAGVVVSTAERLHRLGVTAASARELEHVLRPVVVSCARLRALGWEPSWTNEAALGAHLAQEPPPAGLPAAGAAGAAGATVALVGSAALLRRARRRRRGL